MTIFKLLYQKVQRDVVDLDIIKLWALDVTVLRSHSPPARFFKEKSTSYHVLDTHSMEACRSTDLKTKIQCWWVWISLSLMWCKSSFISITSTARRSDQPHSMLSYKRHYCLLLVFNTWQMYSLWLYMLTHEQIGWAHYPLNLYIFGTNLYIFGTNL